MARPSFGCGHVPTAQPVRCLLGGVSFMTSLGISPITSTHREGLTAREASGQASDNPWPIRSCLQTSSQRVCQMYDSLNYVPAKRQREKEKKLSVVFRQSDGQQVSLLSMSCRVVSCLVLSCLVLSSALPTCTWAQWLICQYIHC